MSNATFSALQKRRGGTEARIAIFKNNRGGRVCRAKGFENRVIAVAFSVFALNEEPFAGSSPIRRSCQFLSELSLITSSRATASQAARSSTPASARSVRDGRQSSDQERGSRVQFFVGGT